MFNIGDIVLLVHSNISGHQWIVTDKDIGIITVYTIQPYSFHGGEQWGMKGDRLISLCDYRNKQLEELI